MLLEVLAFATSEKIVVCWTARADAVCAVVRTSTTVNYTVPHLVESHWRTRVEPSVVCMFPPSSVVGHPAGRGLPGFSDGGSSPSRWWSRPSSCLHSARGSVVVASTGRLFSYEHHVLHWFTHERSGGEKGVGPRFVSVVPGCRSGTVGYLADVFTRPSCDTTTHIVVVFSSHCPGDHSSRVGTATSLSNHPVSDSVDYDHFTVNSSGPPSSGTHALWHLSLPSMELACWHVAFPSAVMSVSIRRSVGYWD